MARWRNSTEHSWTAKVLSVTPPSFEDLGGSYFNIGSSRSSPDENDETPVTGHYFMELSAGCASLLVFRGKPRSRDSNGGSLDEASDLLWKQLYIRDVA